MAELGPAQGRFLAEVLEKRLEKKGGHGVPDETSDVNHLSLGFQASQSGDGFSRSNVHWRGWR
jgi:hypothetical protein